MVYSMIVFLLLLFSFICNFCDAIKFNSMLGPLLVVRLILNISHTDNLIVCEIRSKNIVVAAHKLNNN